MKRSLLTLVLVFPFSYAAKNPEPITLTSDMIKIADGSYINGHDIVDLCRVRIELRKRLLGTGLTDNEHKNCLYDSTYYTIKEMAVLEQTLRKNGLMQGDVYLAMGTSLSIAKRSFLEDIAIPILDKLSKARKYMVPVVRESCEKHSRFDSILLEWEHTDNEHQIEVFMNRIDSFKALGLFCLDVIHLIGDIIHSCPIAYQQFETLKQNYQENLIDPTKAE